MAISDLHCVVGNDQIAVVWAWSNPTRATITVTRLLDGKILNQQTVSKESYNLARWSPSHGPLIDRVDVPIRVTVESDIGERQDVELLDNKYIVEWRIVRQTVYARSLFRKKLIEEQQNLLLNFPCEGEIPNDLFYYQVGQKERAADSPIGYLPALRPGRNIYGLLPTGGKPIILYCNPKHNEVSRLFDFKQLPDQQLPDRVLD